MRGQRPSGLDVLGVKRPGAADCEIAHQGPF
jgi:hypothetical protein